MGHFYLNRLSNEDLGLYKFFYLLDVFSQTNPKLNNLVQVSHLTYLSIGWFAIKM